VGVDLVRVQHPAQHPGDQASPLARRPYDLRHAGVSLALNVGVPATEVARMSWRARPGAAGAPSA
jgi:hypothetical protein